MQSFLIALLACSPESDLPPGESFDLDTGSVFGLLDGVEESEAELDLELIGEAEAARIIWALYPDLYFGEDVMYGEEETENGFVKAYMMSAADGIDIVEVLIDAKTGAFLKKVVLPGYGAMASACTITSISSGTLYNQCDSSWKNTKLGNGSDTICSAGCVVSSIAVVSTNVWKYTETPSTVNDYGKSAGCFSGSSIDIDCAADEHTKHSVSSVSMSQLATEICAGNPILFKRNYGSGYHYMIGYYYSGGSTSSTSSYKVADPLCGCLKTLYGTAASSSPYRKWN
jgi:hypothetical protein